MRALLFLWFAPMSFLVLWLGLASHDVNLGMFFFSRALYDQVFLMYGTVLGLDPESLPPLVLRAIAVDSAIVLSLFALRRRRAITSYVRSWARSRPSSDASMSAASLSSAP